MHKRLYIIKIRVFKANVSIIKPNLNLAQNHHRSTEPAILPNCCVCCTTQKYKTFKAIVCFVNLFIQGKRDFTPQLFVSVKKLDLVPVDNFYRKLLSELDLQFIYKTTQKCYGTM